MELEFIDLGDRSFDDAEVEAIVSHQVAHLLATRRDWLLGKLYRLDVRETDIKAALAQAEADVPTALARLIVERQRERIAVKRRVRVRPLRRDEQLGDMSW